MRYCAIMGIGLGLALLGQGPPAPEKPLLVFDTGGHTGRVQAAVFTPDGKQLITASEDKTVRVWDVDTGACVRVLRPPIGPGPEGMLYAAALSPDGKTLAIAGYGFAHDQPIYLIDFERGEIRAALRGHTRSINALAFSADGRHLASGGFDDTVKVWDPATGACVATLQGHTGAVYTVAFAPDSPHVVSGSFDRTARVWNYAARREDLVLRGHTSTVRAVAWSPDGLTIATGGQDQSVRLWNPRGDLVQSYANLGHEVLRVQFTADSRRLLFSRGIGGAGTPPQCCSLMNVADGSIVWSFADAKNFGMGAAINPRRPLAAVGELSGDVYLLDLNTGKLRFRLGSASRPVLGVGWGPDDQTLAWGSSPSTVRPHPLERAFNLETHQVSEKPGPGFRRARHTDGNTRIEYAFRNQVNVIANGNPPVALTLPQPGDNVQAYSLLPGKRAIVGTSFDLVKFDAQTGKVLDQLKAHVGAVTDVAVSADSRYFATASNDHTLRIWQPDRAAPLLSLLFAGNEWIAWTGQGYYACSPGGENMMGWLIAPGKDKMGIYCASAQVRKKLYRPEVLKLLFKTGDLAAALAELERATRVEQPATSLEKVLPPLVSIVAPAQNPLKLDDQAGAVTITAEAQTVNEYPVQKMFVLVDGRPLPGLDGATTINPPRTGKVQASWKLKLPPGTHEIVVQADSTASKGVSLPLTVRRPTRGIDTEPPPLGGDKDAPPPSLFVLSIGISKYPDKDLQLDYAADDAKAFAEVLKANGQPLFKDIKTNPVLDSKASREGIIEGLQWLQQQAKPYDICVIFYAGHGERDAGSGTFYLLPHDVNRKKVAVTGYSGNDLKAFVGQLAARRVLVVLDTCHAGAFFSGDKARSLPDDVIRDLASTEYGTVVMASSTAGELSAESKDHKHGYFTQAVLEGLKGKAANPQGFVNIAELDLYVTQRVKALTGGNQHPVISRPIRSIPLTAPKLVKKTG